ncbi:unnamed protein product, partial [Polarella glacialis]
MAFRCAANLYGLSSTRSACTGLICKDARLARRCAATAVVLSASAATSWLQRRSVLKCEGWVSEHSFAQPEEVKAIILVWKGTLPSTLGEVAEAFAKATASLSDDASLALLVAAAFGRFLALTAWEPHAEGSRTQDFLTSLE